MILGGWIWMVCWICRLWELLDFGVFDLDCEWFFLDWGWWYEEGGWLWDVLFFFNGFWCEWVVVWFVGWLFVEFGWIIFIFLELFLIVDGVCFDDVVLYDGWVIFFGFVMDLVFKGLGRVDIWLILWKLLLLMYLCFSLFYRFWNLLLCFWWIVWVSLCSMVLIMRLKVWKVLWLWLFCSWSWIIWLLFLIEFIEIG